MCCKIQKNDNISNNPLKEESQFICASLSVGVHNIKKNLSSVNTESECL